MKLVPKIIKLILARIIGLYYWMYSRKDIENNYNIN
jgi:hypothetical protein